MVFPFARRVSERGHGHPHGLRSRTQLLVRMLLCQPTAPGLPTWEPGTSVRRRFSCSSQTSSLLVTILYMGPRNTKHNSGSKNECSGPVRLPGVVGPRPMRRPPAPNDSIGKLLGGELPSRPGELHPGSLTDP